jgi:two-component system chemotaxis sensor kinase CheA
MTGQTLNGPAERQEYLLNEFAAQVVLAGDAAAAHGKSSWLDTLEKLAEEAGAAQQRGLAADAAGLKTELLSLKAGSRAFFDAAEAGIERLGESIHAEPGSSVVAPAASNIADDPELIADFIMESREHLRAIEQNVLAVEQDRSLMDPIHAMFRAFHTIKGIAGFLEFQSIRDVSHETETLLDLARNGKLALTPAVIDVILESADYLSREVSRIEAGDGGASAPTVSLISRLCAVSAGAESQVAETQVAEAKIAETEVAVNQVEKDLTLISEAMDAVTAAAVDNRSGGDRRKGAHAATTIKVDTAKLDFLVDAIGEMTIAQSLIRHHPDLTKTQSASLMRNIAQLSRITSEVQKTAMSMRMVPVGTLFQKMARLVRDLCRKSGKQAELLTYGDDTELDRNIVEELADPLMHMLRNALDHGIETVEQRLAAGKPATAKVELRAAHQGGHILIEIGDDGRGINREAVLRKATERGLIQAGARLSDSEVFALIFEPGFSTAEKVTDISGRGVGMDVVKKQIQKMRGVIETQSTPGQGTNFRLKLPLTLAIIDGLVVGVGQDRYIVPIFAVKEMLRPTPGMVSTIENKREIALIRDRVLPVIRLHRKFSVKPDSVDPLESLLIIAESQEAEFCLMVDKLIGKQEVVIKSLGESLRNISGVAGGAILGDGRVALILEMNALFSSARAV